MTVLGRPVSGRCLAPNTVTLVSGIPRQTFLPSTILVISGMVLITADPCIANSLNPPQTAVSSSQRNWSIMGLRKQSLGHRASEWQSWDSQLTWSLYQALAIAHSSPSAIVVRP